MFILTPNPSPMGRQDKAIDTATFTYDFRETSSSTHRSVVKKVSKHDFDKAGTVLDYTGAHPRHRCI